MTSNHLKEAIFFDFYNKIKQQMRSIFALALIGAVAYASIQDDDNEDFDDIDEYDIDENFLSDDFEYDELDFNVGLSNT